jgi:hypothetical protein
VCATRVISPLDDKATMEIRAQNGEARGILVQAWPMKTIW